FPYTSLLGDSSAAQCNYMQACFLSTCCTKWRMPLANDRVFQMRVSDGFLQSIDDWRRQQPDLPSRAETIRRLVETGLGKSAASRGRNSGSGGTRKPRSTGKSAGRAR